MKRFGALPNLSESEDKRVEIAQHIKIAHMVE
jgi:hypothetical protein